MTLKQALWEIVRDENIIITNQNIDWLLDRASKKATGDAQALKESILERKRVIEENIPSALTNEEKASEKDKLLLITENKSNNFDVKSNNELFKQALVEGLNRHFDKTIEEAKKIEKMAKIAYASIEETDMSYFGVGIDEVQCNAEAYSVAQALYNAGYRKYPCSIGDTVYCIWQYSDFVKIDPPFILEDKVIGFVIDEGIIKLIPHSHHQYLDWYTLRDIKFTKEEAEKALAKMKGGEE